MSKGLAGILVLVLTLNSNLLFSLAPDAPPEPNTSENSPNDSTIPKAPKAPSPPRRRIVKKPEATREYKIITPKPNLEIPEDNKPIQSELVPPSPGKIKITFNRKNEEVKLFYERDMEGGELSSDDRMYIERILSIIDDYRYNTTDENNPFLRFMRKINKYRR